jgi:hypothetical protein
VLRAELELRAGEADGAAGRLEHAFTLACEIEDSCWEGVAARAIGLLESGRGRPEEGRRWLRDALARCTRVPDRYEWAHGYVLEALVGEAVRARDPGARAEAERLHALAARTGMRELVVRAQVHLHALGAPGALDSALIIARDIDNPRLDALLAAHTPAHTPAAQAAPTPREGGSP